MEEDIKIIKASKIMSDDIPHSEHSKRLRKALENLIKGYRELQYKYNKALTDLSIEAKRTNEENYRCSLFAVENNDLKEKLADSIPKSKFREKIEEYRQEMKEIRAKEKGLIWNHRLHKLDYAIQVLQELMEDK